METIISVLETDAIWNGVSLATLLFAAATWLRQRSYQQRMEAQVPIFVTSKNRDGRKLCGYLRRRVLTDAAVRGKVGGRFGGQGRLDLTEIPEDVESLNEIVVPLPAGQYNEIEAI